MSWLADLIHPQTKNSTTMAIELANTAPATSHMQVLTSPTEPAPVAIEPTHPRLFTADPLDGETLERHLVAQTNHRLQGLAQRVAAAKSRLGDLVAADEALSAAEDARHFQGADPEGWLCDELKAVQAQIEQAEAGRKRADARRVALAARVTPLTTAVGRLHTSLVHERDVLAERLYRLKKDGAVSVADHGLIRAGLTREQIESLGPVGQVAVDLVKYTARLEETAPWIAAIERWYSSGYRDYQHLSVLGFDELIDAAQPVDEVVSQ